MVVAADEIPLRSEPAVAALLGALAMATHPASSTPGEVLDVLSGPLVGLTPSDVRRLGRALRSEHHAAGYASPPSDVLIRTLVLGPLVGEPVAAPGLAPDDPVSRSVARLTSLLVEVHGQVAAGASPQEVLWTLWSGGRTPHGWPARLRAAAVQGSRSADHDLDAVMALFDAAERLAGRYPGFLGVRTFIDSLADQQIPAEAVADRGTSADAVRILTAHRAKGLEWDEVWLVGAEEGVWPDLRARGSTLRAEELTRTGIGTGPRPADLLEEERRLFYVACTRARHQLHVTAVDENDQGGDRPSRFIADVLSVLPEASVAAAAGRPRHPVSLDGLVAELRRTALDPAVSAALRQAAVERLAVLAAQVDADDRPLVPLADPRTWWGLAELTASEHPVRPADRPIALSGSGLDGILACPLKWFLEHEAQAETPRGTATSFGSVVHAVADFVAKGEIPASLDDMDAEVDRVWSELRFEARWQSESERREARSALARFLGYHLRQDRELVGTESRVSAEVDRPVARWRRRDRPAQWLHRPGRARRRGPPRADRPEEHASAGGVEGHPRARAAGGLPAAAARGRPLGGRRGRPMASTDDAPIEVGGAALVQLRVDEGKGSTTPACSSRWLSATSGPPGSSASSAKPHISCAPRSSSPPLVLPARTAPTRRPARRRSRASR